MSPPDYTTDEMRRFLEELPWWADIPEHATAKSFTFAAWLLATRLRQAGRDILDIMIEDLERIIGKPLRKNGFEKPDPGSTFSHLEKPDRKNGK